MSLPPPRSRETAEQDVRRWLEQVVIGLQLCPFARQPYQTGRIRFVVSQSKANQELLSELERELLLLDTSLEDQVETTLVIVVAMLTRFDDFNQFLDDVDDLLQRGNWTGVYQVASFHPDYQFAETEPADPGNLTNRSPWPILHLLREASITRAVKGYADVEEIPDRNIARMSLLSDAERRTLFPWQ